MKNLNGLHPPQTAASVSASLTLETYKKCRIGGPTGNLLNQNLHFKGILQGMCLHIMVYIIILSGGKRCLLIEFAHLGLQTILSCQHRGCPCSTDEVTRLELSDFPKDVHPPVSGPALRPRSPDSEAKSRPATACLALCFCTASSSLWPAVHHVLRLNSTAGSP